MIIISIISIFITSFLLLRILNLRGFVVISLALFLFLSSQIVVTGFITSWLNQLSNIKFWTGIHILFLVISTPYYFASCRGRTLNLKKIFHNLLQIKQSFKLWIIEDCSSFQRIILFLLGTTFLFLTILHVAIIFNVAPHNWDSMTYHLARVAYFIQYDSLNHFRADYWAQNVHPKNASILNIYILLITGLRENFTQAIQFFSYLFGMISIYGISKLIGGNRFQSITAALIFSLLLSVLMEATTTQNDLIITSLVGSIVYFSFLWHKTLKNKYLALASLAGGLASGVKSSFILTIPSIAVIFIFLLYQAKIGKKEKIKTVGVVLLFVLISIVVFALPSGYMENIIAYGHPIGPEYVLKMHSFHGKSLDYILITGSHNVWKFILDFLSLRAHEDSSYWGFFGFGLIGISTFLSLFGVIQSKPIRVLSLATVVFLLVTSYTSTYNPWFGRYFNIATIFAVPTVIELFHFKNRFFRYYILIILILGTCTALLAVLLRYNSDPFGYRNKSIFTMNRLEQLTRNRKCYLEVFENYEKLVPKTTKVATILGPDSYEYPLFGKYLTRTILPLNSFRHERKPIPQETEYLFFSTKVYQKPLKKTDIYLGCKTLYLRKLN